MFKQFLASASLALLLPSCDSADAVKNSPSGDEESLAIIQIFPTNPVLSDPALVTDNYIANQFASLTMRETAKLASEKSQIDADEIQAALKVERISGTDMARLTARSDESAKSKKIVEATVEAYMSIRKSFENNNARRTLDALDEEIITQSDKVQDHRKDLTVLIQQYGIPFFEGTESSVGKTEIDMFDSSRKRLMDLEIEALLLTAKFKTLGQNDDERQKLEPQIETITAQIEALTQHVNDQQRYTIDLSLRQHTYNQAKEAYLQSRNMLRDMKVRQQEARVALKMPRDLLMLRQKPE